MNIPEQNLNGWNREVSVTCEHTDTCRLENWRLWCRNCGALGEFAPRTFAGALKLEWSVPKRDWGEGT